MKVSHLALLLVGSLSVIQCSPTSSPERQQLLPINEHFPLLHSELTKKVAASSTIEEPEKLNLPTALALTLEKNPELRSFSQGLRVGEARIIQAGVRPNPELSITIEDALSTSGGDSYSQATLQLGQVIELGGKRSARIDTATAYQDQLKDDYEIKRVEILSGLTDKFIRTAADEHLYKLAEKGEGLAMQSLQNIQRRSHAGGASELEETKAKVLVAQYRIASEHAEHELLSSKTMLAAFWGEETPKFIEISSDLFQSTPLPSFDDLSARIEHSPEIRRWATEKRLREAEKKLADARSIPNITLGAGPRRLEQTNDTAWVFQFSVPLPAFDRNQGAREEAEIQSNRVALDTDATRLRLKSALFALYQEAKHAQTELQVMAQEILPQAEHALKTAQSGYDQGRFSYLDLVDAQRTLLEVHRENIEAAYSFHSFVNSIERLLGAPLHDKYIKG